MNQLLNRPLKTFALYAFLVLLCSIPAYYLLIDHIWLSELDKHNKILSKASIADLQHKAAEAVPIDSLVGHWNSFQHAARLDPAAGIKPDSSYEVFRANLYANGERNRYRGLLSYFTLRGQAYRLSVESNVEESDEMISALTMITILFCAILLLGLILLNRRIAARLWQPFYNSLQKIQSFDLSSQRLPAFESSSIVEFEQLNKSLEQVLNANIDVYRQQKEFIENAAHELQTPLAIVQSKLDLLLQNSALTKEQSNLVQGTNNALAKVSRINKNLLLLAKLENHQYADTGSFSVQEALEELLDLLEDFALGSGVQLSLSEPPSSLLIKGNKTLLEIMLSNLLMNAIRYSKAPAEVEVRLSEQQLRISNPGTQALNEGQLFKRFSKVSAELPSSGLGLAIIREICHRYGWQASYAFEEQKQPFYDPLLSPVLA